MSHSPPIVLTFAASDPAGGAGLQADLLTLAGMGCHPLSVVTALTMQDTRGGEGILAVEADWVAGQARHLLEDMRVAAFKLGVFGSLENIRTVADVISDYPKVPVILDPVLASGRGDRRRRRRDRARRMREAAARARLRVRPGDRDPRGERGSRQYPVCRRCRGARRSLAASSGQLSRLGLHARFGDRCGARQRTRSRGSGARRAGIHLAGARRRFPSRHGPAPSRPLFLGARGRRREVKLRGLYAITPEAAESAALLAMLQDALEGGAALLQYRRRKPDVLEAKEVVHLARRHGVPVIVNDDVELALEVSADGAHLGREDGDLRAARARLAGRILGASSYDRLQLARAAVASGADYVAFGSVFASPTKPGAVQAAHSLFTRARHLGVPLAAIGGITLENAPRLISAGADLLAVISDLFEAPDVTLRARQYGKLFT